MSIAGQGPPVEALERELRQMSATSAFFSSAIAERLSMSSHELEAMDLLNLHGPMPLVRLADLTGLTSGGVTRLVDRLEQDGFVRRTPDPQDRRRVLVNLMEEEIAARVAPLFASMADQIQAMAESYPAEQLSLIIDFLHRANEIAETEVRRARSTR